MHAGEVSSHRQDITQSVIKRPGIFSEALTTFWKEARLGKQSSAHLTALESIHMQTQANTTFHSISITPTGQDYLS